MDRGTVLLQQLRSQLDCWVDRIQRGVGAASVRFLPLENGEFILRAVWSTPDGEKVHEKRFSREHVFGRTMGGSPLGLRVQQRACDYARDFMREILTARGAIR